MQTPSVKPITSTHGLLLFSSQKPVSSTQKSASSTHKKDQLNKTVSSTQKTRYTTQLSVQHQNIKKTIKPKNYHLILYSLSDWKKFKARLYRAIFCRFWCWTDGCVEHIVFCVNLTVFVLNWRILEAEKEWLFCVELMCWTDGVLNWGGQLWLTC